MSWWRRERWKALEIFGLCGLAVAQPLYEVFGASPEVFVFADATNRDIVAFALILLLGPPLLLWGVGALIGAVAPRARRPVHLATLGLLAALLVMYLVKHQGWYAGWLLPALGGAAGALLVWAYRRRESATTTLLHYLALGPVLFVVSFLALSPAGELLRPANADAVDLDLARPDELPPVVMIVFEDVYKRQASTSEAPPVVPMPTHRHATGGLNPVTRESGQNRQLMSSILSSATRAHSAVVGSTWIWFTTSPATRDSSTHARWGPSMRNMVEQLSLIHI